MTLFFSTALYTNRKNILQENIYLRVIQLSVIQLVNNNSNDDLNYFVTFKNSFKRKFRILDNFEIKNLNIVLKLIRCSRHTNKMT